MKLTHIIRMNENAIPHHNPFKDIAQKFVNGGAHINHISKNGSSSIYLLMDRLGTIRISDHDIQSRHPVLAHDSADVEITVNLTPQYDVRSDGHAIVGTSQDRRYEVDEYDIDLNDLLIEIDKIVDIYGK